MRTAALLLTALVATALASPAATTTKKTTTTTSTTKKTTSTSTKTTAKTTSTSTKTTSTSTKASSTKSSSSAAPSATDITITSVSFSGNGCPQGSVSTSLSTDGTVVTFGFDDFQTYIGPGTAVSDHTKNCQLHLELAYPGGFNFAVVDSTYHGYAQLDDGVTGSFLSTYYFSQDAAATTTTKTTITGGGVWASGQVYTKEDTVPTASYIWSPCGASGILNINNRIALTSTSDNATGEITDDDATVAFQQEVHFQWFTC